MTGTRAVIAAVALLLGLSACSGEDPKPQVAPPSPTSPSTTGTSAETPPEMPDAAKGRDAAAAEAFVEFYFDVVNYAQATGDVGPLRALARLCDGCVGGTQTIVDTYERGGEIRGGEGSARRFEVSFLKREPRPWASVECTVFTSAQVVDLPGKAEDEEYSAGSTDVRLLLEPATSGWVVRSLVTR